MSNATNPVPKVLYSVTQVAAMTGFSRAKLYEMVAEGKIETIIVEGRMRVTREALNNWIAQQPRRSR